MCSLVGGVYPLHIVHTLKQAKVTDTYFNYEEQHVAHDETDLQLF